MRRFTAEQVDAAVLALAQPGRFDRAQEIVTHAAAGLHQVLEAALHEGGWFGPAHDEQVSRAALAGDEQQRLALVRALVAEETRLGMLVGVAVGLELADELDAAARSPREEDGG